MKFFNFKPHNDLIKLLKQSKQNFQFDQGQVKNRLLYTLGDAPIKTTKLRFFSFRLVKYSVSLAVLLVFLSATFAFASNAKPGEKLFALNKFGEKVMLSLPLSVQQKAQLQARIVTKRLEALTALKNKPDPNLETQKLETVKESDESIQQAIDTISTNKEKFEGMGQTQTAEKLNQVLNQLEKLSKRHEEQIRALEAGIPNSDIRHAMHQHLLEIKTARHKARLELNLTDSEDQTTED
jgi:hypothetical protein